MIRLPLFFRLAALLLAGVPVLAGCGQGETVETPPARADEVTWPMTAIQTEPYGEVDGRPITQYFLANENGLTVALINYGATVTSVSVPDRDGRFANITLAFPGLDRYLDNPPYLGGICGRFANRIAGGKFTLDETEYTLATNNGPNHLHGGDRGFNRVVWHGEPLPVADDGALGVRFTYVSPDGEEGYPGTLKVTVTYTLTSQDELKMEYTAQTDKATPVNLTNHSYWNLAGEGNVLGHVLELNCEQYVPTDKELIPTGGLASVTGTPLDFRHPTAIGERLAEVKGDDPAGGYDLCYVIDGGGKKLTLAARVFEPASGRLMEVHTTEPGVQLYTGNFLDGSESNGGFGQHTGFCLECQHLPDSPNQPDFPSTILEPGRVYTQTTIHKFSVRPPHSKE